MHYKTIAEQIFLAGIESVLPARLMNRVMFLQGNCLIIDNLSFNLETIENIYVIGAGKAGAMMGLEVEKILGARITEGHIVVKYGYSCQLKYIGITEAGHPIPDSNGLKATAEILNLAGAANCNDLVICLISGGGSSLLHDIPEGCSAADMIKAYDLLINCGASISEINAVRKHLSVIKGGQLARIVYPATLVNFILSDVPGNHLDVIASGPTVPDPTTYLQALTVLATFGLSRTIPRGVITSLKEGAAGKRPETPKAGDPVFNRTYNILVGSNRVALEAAKLKALEFNINAVIIEDQLQGDIVTIAEYIVDTCVKFKNDVNEIKPVCLLFGGETTVRVTGKGVGGRNQHLALHSGILIQDIPGITILCASTDGNDGPTGIAGAVVDSDTGAAAISNKIDPQKYLTEFDSFHFFKKTGNQIITGPTMTNVMDIIVALVL